MICIQILINLIKKYELKKIQIKTLRYSDIQDWSLTQKYVMKQIQIIQGHLGLNSKASHARKSVQIPMKTTNSTNSTQVGPTWESHFRIICPQKTFTTFINKSKLKWKNNNVLGGLPGDHTREGDVSAWQSHHRRTARALTISNNSQLPADAQYKYKIDTK